MEILLRDSETIINYVEWFLGYIIDYDKREVDPNIGCPNIMIKKISTTIIGNKAYLLSLTHDIIFLSSHTKKNHLSHDHNNMSRNKENV